VPALSDMTSCTPINFNSYLDNSSATVLSQPAVYILLIFHVPNLMSIFFSLGHLSKEYVQIRGSLLHFVTSLFFTARSC
jgi:hypothetical protein